VEVGCLKHPGASAIDKIGFFLGLFVLAFVMVNPEQQHLNNNCYGTVVNWPFSTHLIKSN